MFLVSICNYSGAQFSDAYGIFHLIVFNYNDYVVSHIIKCFPYVRYNKSIISLVLSTVISILIQLSDGINACVLGLHRHKHKHLILYPQKALLIAAGLIVKHMHVCGRRDLFIQQFSPL